MSYNSKYKGSEVEELLNSIKDKQDVITDLSTIREGAALGATALQEESFKGTVTSIVVGNGLIGGSITELGTIELPLINNSIYDVNVVTSIPNGGFWSSDLSLNMESIILEIPYFIISNDVYGRVKFLQSNTSHLRTTFKVNGATTSLAGFMTADDKTKLDGIDMTTKQDTLVSGTNIKTINGESILGSGNIVIEGGSGGSSSGGSGVYVEVNHGTSDTTFTLTPNTFHVWDEVTTLDLSFSEETSGVANEYLFQFTSGTTATTLTLPDDIKWANDSVPTIAENMIYQISVLKGLASVLEFSNVIEILVNYAVVGGNTITFAYPVASDLTISYMGRAAGASGAPANLTTTISAGEISVTPGGSVFSINSITPESDDKYVYSFQQS